MLVSDWGLASGPHAAQRGPLVGRQLNGVGMVPPLPISYSNILQKKKKKKKGRKEGTKRKGNKLGQHPPYILRAAQSYKTNKQRREDIRYLNNLLVNQSLDF